MGAEPSLDPASLAEAIALSQGRTQQLWRVDITDATGRLIAHGELRLQNVPGRS
jgi:1,4-dihydroxy-2-naphthoyl-CoA hydrolase